MKRPRRLVVLALGLMLATLTIGLWLGANVGWAGAVDASVGFFREAGPVPFFAAMAILPMFGVPLSPFTVVAGPVFGPTMGVGTVVLCSLVAVVVNVTVSYWIATHAFRPVIVRLARRAGYAVPVVPPDAVWMVTLLVRIIPGVPFFLQSYLLGLARVPFGIYLVISTIVPAAYLSGTILFGDALMRGDHGAMLGAAAIFLVAGAVLHQLRRRFRNRVRLTPQSQPDAEIPAPESRAN